MSEFRDRQLSKATRFACMTKKRRLSFQNKKFFVAPYRDARVFGLSQLVGKEKSMFAGRKHTFLMIEWPSTSSPAEGEL